MILSMVVLGAIGDIRRFETAKKLVGYAGLGSSVHDSGQTHRQGRITKAGRKELRWALVEAAHRAVMSHPHWKTLFHTYQKRMSKAKAYVAIARKLLVVIWHVLSKRVIDCHSDENRVAYKMLSWAWQLDDHQRRGLSRPQFVRWQLLHMGIGNDLTHIRTGDKRRRIAPVDEVLSLTLT
jgi:hypothetical protein